MRRSTLLTLVVAALSAAPASAHGHHRGPVEVRYYYPPVYVVPTYRPVYVAPPTYVMPTAPVLVPSGPVLPPVPVMVTPTVPLSTLAVPLAAPPSATPEPPAPTASTSLRVSGSSYDQYSGTPGRAGARCSVAFWNLTTLPLTLHVEGNDYTMPAGRSLTLDLPRSFTWQVAGRAAQAATIPPADGTAEILIRR